MGTNDNGARRPGADTSPLGTATELEHARHVSTTLRAEGRAQAMRSKEPDRNGRAEVKQTSKLKRPRVSWRAELAGSTPVEPTDQVYDHSPGDERLRSEPFTCDRASDRPDQHPHKKPSRRPSRASKLATRKMIVVLKFTRSDAITTPTHKMMDSRAKGETELHAHIVDRTMHRRRLPTYTVQLPNGGEFDDISLDAITKYVSVAELERFEHLRFETGAQALAIEGNPGIEPRGQVGMDNTQDEQSGSSSVDSSPLSSLRSSVFDDSPPPTRRFSQSPNSRRKQAHSEALSVPYEEVGIFETLPGEYRAAINPAGVSSSDKWVTTTSLVTARKIETGVDDGEDPEYVAYIACSRWAPLIVEDTEKGTARDKQWGTVDKTDNTRGTMPAHKQRDWVLMPLVPASKENLDFVGVSSVVEVTQGSLIAYVEVQRHPLMNPATANVVAVLYLKSDDAGKRLVGHITSILIDKSILDDDDRPAWLNRTRGPPPLLIDIFDGQGRALPAFRRYAAQLEQTRILVLDKFWFKYDTPDIVPEHPFFAALPRLTNGYAFDGTIVVAPNQRKNPANKRSIIAKWKKSCFEMWQEWKGEEAPLVLGRAWWVRGQ